MSIFLYLTFVYEELLVGYEIIKNTFNQLFEILFKQIINIKKCIRKTINNYTIHN